MSAWIKSSEQMPELREGDNDFSKTVLIRLDAGKVVSGNHSHIDDCWYSEDGEWLGDDADIRHWMPLPEPPQDA